MPATTYKVLNQATTTPANTLQTLYTVPANTQTLVSSVAVCNQTSVTHTFRVSVRIAGTADTASQYLYYDTPINANDSFVFTIGVTLGPTDVVSIQSDVGSTTKGSSISFNLFGAEMT